jgi:hypothetical protein
VLETQIGNVDQKMDQLCREAEEVVGGGIARGLYELEQQRAELAIKLDRKEVSELISL